MSVRCVDDATYLYHGLSCASFAGYWLYCRTYPSAWGWPASQIERLVASCPVSCADVDAPPCSPQPPSPPPQPPSPPPQPPPPPIDAGSNSWVTPVSGQSLDSLDAVAEFSMSFELIIRSRIPGWTHLVGIGSSYERCNRSLQLNATDQPPVTSTKLSFTHP